jgi:hypothetical protein
MESAQKRRARSLHLPLLSLARQNSNTVQILSEDMTIPQSSLIGPTALCFVLLLGISNAQPRSAPPMKVKLSVSTFDPASLREFQSLADEISAIIDEMIPGVPADYPADGIVCFEAPSRWTADAYKANGFSPPPLTFTGPKVYDEPEDVVGGRIRIALVAHDRWQFAFQLSHELAHVKMGPRTDNYLDETFAVAVSYEVLRRLGYQGYLLRDEGASIEQLSPAIQKQLAYQEWKSVQAYWRETSKSQANTIDNKPFQTVGALLLLRGKGPHWSQLLNIASLNRCANSIGPQTFEICNPDLMRLKMLRHELQALGFTSEDLRR